MLAEFVSLCICSFSIGVFVVNMMGDVIVNVTNKTMENKIKFGMQAVLTVALGKGQELSGIMLQTPDIAAKLERCEFYLVQQAIADDSKVLIAEVQSTALRGI